MEFIKNANYSLHKKRSVRLWSNTIGLDDRLIQIIGSLHNSKGDDIEVLKRDRRRCVIRVNHPNDELPSLIVKAFPLLKLESRFKYKRYGLAEAYNYIHAAKLGLAIPEYYGYFQYHRFGTVKANGVLIEDLKSYQTLHELALERPQEKLKIFSQAIPIIQQLFESGANHIDTTAHNFMVSPSGEKIVAIDWQYCSFHKPNNIDQLTLQAVQFLRYTDMTESNSPDWTAWLKELHTTCAPEGNWETFRHNVHELQSQKRASTRSRLALDVPMPSDKT